MEIKISKTAHACTACSAKFEHDQYVYSHVIILEETLSREDHCAQCKDTAARQKAYSAWTTQYYDPKVAEAEPAEQFSPLRRLFYESVEAEARAEQAKAFLAAQLLRRQKVFRLIKQSDEADGAVKMLLYADRIGNRLIEVRDPNFSFNELDTARVHLMERLRVLESGEEAADTAQQDARPASDEREPSADDGAQDAEAAASLDEEAGGPGEAAQEAPDGVDAVVTDDLEEDEDGENDAVTFKADPDWVAEPPESESGDDANQGTEEAARDHVKTV